MAHELSILDFPSDYKTPSMVGTIYNLLDASTSFIFNGYVFSGQVSITYDNGEEIVFTANSVLYPHTKIVFSDKTFVIKPGKNIIKYTLELGSTIAGVKDQITTHTFIIFGVENKYPLAPWTIKDVINRVLELERPLLVDNASTNITQPRFKLQIPEGKEAIFKQNAPEFTFTRQTLREVLQTIGGYIHAEPRLLYNEETGEFDTITFDFYGEQEYATYINVNTKEETRLSEYAYENLTGSYGIEQACTALDSYVDNLVNRLKASGATVGQPYEGGKQTLRTESANLRLEEGNMYLPTAYPISQVHKLYWVDSDGLAGEAGKGYDLTPYLYEANVYNSLSSYDNVYPVSKTYALYYTQEKKGVYGFWYEAPSWDGTGYLSKYAITNIIKAASSYDITNGLTTDSELAGMYKGLCFRVEYTPVYSARISHSKSYIGDWLKYPRVLNYSQGANMVETEYYGENIKGAVERLGNIELVYTFTCFNLETIPKAGQLWDDEYYIASVAVEVMQDKFKVSVGLSKNFNRVSQYVGVSSYKRIYEVSEVMVQARETMYRDYIVITGADSDNYTAGKACFINPNAMQAIAQTFMQDGNVFKNRASEDGTTSTYSPKAVKVTAQGYSKTKTPLSAVTLPVIASAEGNVMEFSWEYQDNYSAGLRTVPVDDNHYSQDVQYSDYYGRMYYERFSILATGYDDREITSVTDGGTGIGRYSFPYGEANGHDLFGNYVTGASYIVRRKDSREAMKNGYAVEFVTDKKGFVIGSALASSCPLVVGMNGHKALLVILKKRINKFTRLVDLSEDNIAAVLTVNVRYDEAKNIVYSDGVTSGVDGAAWAYVTEKYYGDPYTVETEDGTTKEISSEYGGELLFGCNKPISPGETVGAFKAIAAHDIYDYLKTKS